MGKNPKHISFNDIRQVLDATPEEKGNHPFMCDELAVVNDSSFIFHNALEMNIPYIIEDVRMLVVTEGEVDVTVNLIDKHFVKGMVVFMGYGSIMQVRRVSDDFKVRGFMMQRNLAERVLHNHLTSIYLEDDKTRECQVDESSVKMLTGMHSILWKIVTRDGYREDVVVPTLMMFSNYFVSLMDGESRRNGNNVTHSNRVFKNFISLVNKHCRTEHAIGFYADEMCMSAHHLGLIVRSESGVTAKEWIERAIITQAKLMLKSEDLQAAEVASRLSFSNPSFFSKYFKRITGMTPQEYKRGSAESVGRAI